jgi:16S rRNA (cytosine1402-N4)-methyltransferase
MKYHESVLLHESIEGLDIKSNGTYIDVTFGGGGHSKLILQKLGHGKLFAFDQDTDAKSNLIDDDRFVLINENFRFLKKFLRLNGITQVDGVLADLGVSSHQFDQAKRGFSIRFDGDLDMRMNQNQSLTAKEVINEYELDDLCKIFKLYGELNNAYSLSRAIIDFRKDKEIVTTEHLKEAVKSHTPPHKSNKILAQLFQAIRIEVNDELGSLKEMLTQAVDLLKPNGRLSVISYHSLEDRLVKHMVRSGNFKGELIKNIYGVANTPLKAINRKPIVPDLKEVVRNSRARSAKLRISEKVK